MTWLRTARDWLAYRAVMAWPTRYMRGEPFRALLPYAGAWAYRNEVERAARDE